MPREKLLFVCSRNRWRSRAAELLWRGHPRYDVRSAGTSDRARIRVTACHVAWADRIFCMEARHAAMLRERFPDACGERLIVVLRVPDDYPSSEDPALHEHLRAALAPYLTAH